jgi:two-component system sensor histidine kinase CreC
MIEQLLTLSRLENSSNLEHFKEFNLSHLLKEIYADFTERHPQRKLCLNNLENADYFGDPLLITTAIHNLLNNALEFSERYSEVQLSLEGTNDQYTISVTDLGVGIPEYARLQVFDKFYSLPRPDSGRKSSGLGLSITQEIAKMHQGNVTLKSQEKGTIAELRLLRL